MTETNSAGRPTIFTPELAAAICLRLASGETLRAICRDEDMPGRTTVFRWLADIEEFRDQYARARDAQADSWADEIVDVARNTEEGETRTVGIGANGPIDKTVTGDMFNHRRLKVDALKWAAGKAAPKKYGERVEHVGKDGGPIEHKTVVVLPSNGRGDDQGAAGAAGSVPVVPS